MPRSPLLLSLLLLCFLLPAAETEALRQQHPMYVVFGRPGAGKTTVANAALELLSSSTSSYPHEVVGLDLDVCVTRAMRDNFGRGIYPTLEERKVFAIDACDYVDKKLGEAYRNGDDEPSLCAVVSFSFVNTDLRDIFRERFPSAEWILVDTTEGGCERRIREREGHFYKGKIVPDDGGDKAATEKVPEDEDKENDDDADNSDWKFAPVEFPHLVLEGSDPVEENARKIVEKIRNDTQ